MGTAKGKGIAVAFLLGSWASAAVSGASRAEERSGSLRLVGHVPAHSTLKVTSSPQSGSLEPSAPDSLAIDLQEESNNASGYKIVLRGPKDDGYRITYAGRDVDLAAGEAELSGATGAVRSRKKLLRLVPSSETRKSAPASMVIVVRSN